MPAKKINTTAIGNRTAAKAKEYLTRLDYSVQVVHKGRYLSKWGWRSYGEDFFGVFDAVAVHPSGDFRYLQFTTRGDTTSIGQANVRKAKLLAWAEAHSYPTWQDATIEMWTWVKRKGWIIEILMDDLTWSPREQFHSSPRKEGGAAGENVDRPAAPDGKSGEPVSPIPKE